MMYISTAYITCILPVEYSIIYLSLNCSLILLFGVGASIFTWLLLYYSSYRMAFLIHNILVLITFIIVLVLFVYKKQRKLQKEQLHIEQILPHQNQVPEIPIERVPAISIQRISDVSVERIIQPLSDMASPAPNAHSTENTENKKRFAIFLNKMNIIQSGDKLYGLILSAKMQWYLVVHYIVQVGILYGIISMFYTYYLRYLFNKFDNATAWECGVQLILSSIASSLGGITALFCFNKSTYLSSPKKYYQGN